MIPTNATEEVVVSTLMNVCGCQNGGTCVNNTESPYCVCKPGFRGFKCECEYDVCYDRGRNRRLHRPGQK
ncbi:hypothetical protein NP493_1744g00018 [Ridgeia piscesae]|uniref:EGF-like domain-containing protein n=1 Tax=Ridgeia piscesae TaxID=27915 RepID=A0AAD9N700_RIDPI|nr:hypothetical protein NP493_1744g00018 [Ridgeia piscesae]